MGESSFGTASSKLNDSPDTLPYKSSFKPPEKMRGRRVNFPLKKARGNQKGGGGGLNVFERRERLKIGFILS